MSTAVTPPMHAHGWNVYFLAASNSFHFAGLFRLDGFDITYREIFGRDAHLLCEASSPPVASPAVITSTDLDQLVTCPPAATWTTPGEHPALRFHLIRHRSCDLATGCAQHIRRTIRHRDARYLPLQKPSRAIARRSSQSPSKQSASSSTSLNKNSKSSQLPVNKEEDLTNMVAPPDTDIVADIGQRTIAGFRSSCLVAAQQCAVLGKGRSWCISPAVGPALQACHIIPQKHYHLYPDPEGPEGPNGDDDVELIPRRLENGIFLLSHLHELFDSRLFSIHPERLQIGTFMTYNILCDYHRHIAKLPSNVDRNALRHHYNIDRVVIHPRGYDLQQMAQIPAIRSALDEPYESVCEHKPKRRRISAHRLQEFSLDGDGITSPRPTYDSYITPPTSQLFLADVNWKLRKLTPSQD
ncbi:hypothetical protein V8C37DRAFT_410628 [Trichoderma ceciliae]